MLDQSVSAPIRLHQRRYATVGVKPDHRVSPENLSRYPDRFSETAAGGEDDSPDHHWEDSRVLATLETMTDSIMSPRQMCHLFAATTGSGRLLTRLARGTSHFRRLRSRQLLGHGLQRGLGAQERRSEQKLRMAGPAEKLEAVVRDSRLRINGMPAPDTASSERMRRYDGGWT